ncbi:MAG: Rrf2 family transcriptional regulator [Sinomicrobium sp.]|nr:Rrf2 family transcriptional regulator [Sinomicrobium sp.]
MLSNASKYAINAVLYLAIASSEDRKIGSREIAGAIDVPVPFLAKLLQNLARKNIISSSKGPGGGFYLTRENRELKLISIVEHIDGLSKFEDCILGLKDCSSEKPCPIHFSVQPFKEMMFRQLNDNTIESFAVKIRRGETFLHY